MNKIISLLPEKLKKDKKLLVIMFLGIFAIILLLLSEITGGKEEKQDTEVQTEFKQVDIESYSEDIENRLTELVSSIDGAGRTRVMVTLKCGSEQVYAENIDIENEVSRTNGIETGIKSKREGEYIILNTGSGENGLILKVLQPEIRGVAVVCEGASSAGVRKDVTEAVSAVLGISSARISVTKMGDE